MNIKNNKKVHYLLKAFKHLGDDEYMDYLLNRETDYGSIEVSISPNGTIKQPVMIIPEMGKGCGFFCEFNGMLEAITYADMMGFAPIINWDKDFLYYDGTYKSNGNPFLYYFMQPSSYGMNDIENVSVISYGKPAYHGVLTKLYQKDFDINDEYASVMAQTYQKYIRFNDNVDKMLGDDIGNLVGEKKSILGVHYRGTDFKQNYNQHPVNVKLDQTKTAIDEALDKYDFDTIFLATDDMEAVRYFKDIYADKIVIYDDVYRGDGNTSVAFSTDPRDNHKFRLGYEVIRDMYTLAQCDGLIAGVSQVSITARIVKKANGSEWKYINIINNGKNNNGKEFKK